MEYTKGEWEVRTYKASVFGNQAALTCKEVWAGERRIASSINEANAQLIASAVNACIKVNSDNPMAVAEVLPDLYEACKIARRELIHAQWEDGLDQIEQAIAKVENQ